MPTTISPDQLHGMVTNVVSAGERRNISTMTQAELEAFKAEVIANTQLAADQRAELLISEQMYRIALIENAMALGSINHALGLF